ncbi:adenine deaminase [Halobacillus rhizosphaerae]|uniref:adenine deaminase n=1 Tax=Halobacillus rhizosphaerae TaxID=3064889 RepID=UPI00398A86A9
MIITMDQRKKLAATALGKLKADVVIQKGTLINVHSNETLPDIDIAIKAGCIAYIGEASHLIGSATEVIQAHGRFLTPGLIDGHMHVESTMMSVTEFAKSAIKQGTTTIFMDPHEIANVFGLEGVRWMHEEGQQLPLRVSTTIPSCVPATEDLEDAGAELTIKDIEEGLTWNNVSGLGEVMNFPGVIHGDEKMTGEIDATIRAGKTVTGHMPAEDPAMLQAYIASGVTSCHETVTREQAIEKLRLGMHVMIREGSAWQDVKQLAPIITKDHMPTDNLSLITDDVYPQTLVSKGHLNHVVRRAIEEGIDPLVALKLATINIAHYFNCGDTLGSLSPGKHADILMIDDLEEMKPSTVVIGGKMVYDQGNYLVSFPEYRYPDKAKNSVHLKEPLKAEDFYPKSAQKNKTEVQVIDIIENNARTKKGKAELHVKDGIIESDVTNDVIRLTCIDRHHGSGDISHGFARGFQLKSGAVASTVAHDSHNLLVMGVSEEDMAIAANHLAEIGGGMAAVENGQILASVPMPIAGLMSEEPLETVAAQVEKLEEAWKKLGCPIHAPFMTFSLIALPVIPSLRITNRGLADVDSFALTPLEINEQ